jgi:hypothetical protein
MKKVMLFTTMTAAFNLALITSAYAATYGGQATGASVTVTATGTTIRANSGSLSIAGGEADAALSVGNIPGSATGGVATLAASALSSVVIGTGSTTKAHALLGAVALAVSGNQVNSDFVMARSNADCGPTVSGTSDVVNLVINGQSITVTGAPNQTVALSNGSVTINEQVQTIGATSGELTVNALHVRTNDAVTGQPVADVALGTADAKIDCADGSSPGEAWVSGGGWIVGSTGGKATFGFVAGPGGTPTRGHFTLQDQSTNQTVFGAVIDSGTMCIGQGQSNFSGHDANSSSTFNITVTDNGEPGAGRDTLQVIAATDTNGVTYANTNQVLQAGNIQAHGFTCP